MSIGDDASGEAIAGGVCEPVSTMIPGTSVLLGVTGVVGYRRQRRPLTPTDTAETQRVFSVSLCELAQPQRWETYCTAGWRGPSLRLDGDALLWGYTAEVLWFIGRNVKTAK